MKDSDLNRPNQRPNLSFIFIFYFIFLNLGMLVITTVSNSATFLKEFIIRFSMTVLSCVLVTRLSLHSPRTTGS